MIAEYLILKTDEALYWKLANVFPLSKRFDYRVLLAAVFDLGLFLNLVRTVYRIFG